MIEIEQELLGISHADLGAELAAHWNLPDEIVSVLRFHHTPDASAKGEGLPLARIINITEKLLSSSGMREFVGYQISAVEWESLGIPPEQADEIAMQVAEQADQAIQFAATL